MINLGGASADPVKMAGPVVAALSSKACRLTSLILTGASGLDQVPLTSIFNENVATQIGPTLQKFMASRCGFHGCIPPGIWKHCSSLQILDLSDNYLEGIVLPLDSSANQVACLDSLERLDLSGNRSLCGRLANWLSLCKKLVRRCPAPP